MTKRTLTVTDQNLPEGLYQFKILEFTEEIDPKKGLDLFKIKMATASLEDGKARMAWDRFPVDLEWKLTLFLLSTGHVLEGKTVVWDDAEMVGKEGYFECKHNVEKGGTRIFDNKYYLHPEDERVFGLGAVEIEVPAEKPPTLLAKLRAQKEAKVNGSNGTEDNPHPGHTRIGAQTEVAN
jgi:hypothetical protein